MGLAGERGPHPDGVDRCPEQAICHGFRNHLASLELELRDRLRQKAPHDPAAHVGEADAHTFLVGDEKAFPRVAVKLRNPDLRARFDEPAGQVA